MVIKIGDAKRYEADYAGYNTLDDASEMKSMLDAIVSNADGLIKELTTGKRVSDEVG